MRINSPKVYTKTDEKKPIEKKRRKNIKKMGIKKRIQYKYLNFMSSLKQFLVNQDKQETKIHWTMGRSEVRRQLRLQSHF